MSWIDGVKAITFDLDGTLWDLETVIRSSLASALEEIANHDPRTASQLDVEGMMAIRNVVAKEPESAAMTLEEVRLEAFRRTLAAAGRPNDALAERVNAVYFRHRFSGIQPYPDVRPALDALRHRYRIGVLTNGNSYPDRVDFGGVFDFAVLAQDHGVKKPDRRIFDIAAERAGCHRHELLHVGDDLEDDVEGAMGAGVRSVWINRSGAERPTSIDGVPEITNLTQLFEMLEDL